MSDESGLSSKFVDLLPDDLQVTVIVQGARYLYRCVQWAVRRRKFAPSPGAYELRSLSALVTGGVTLEPPAVSGTLILGAPPQKGKHGSLSLCITLPDGLGGSTTFVDEGTYTVRRDGAWEQTSQLAGGKGAFTLVRETLTVETTEPKLNQATMKWKKVSPISKRRVSEGAHST